MCRSMTRHRIRTRPRAKSYMKRSSMGFLIYSKADPLGKWRQKRTYPDQLNIRIPVPGRFLKSSSKMRFSKPFFQGLKRVAKHEACLREFFMQVIDSHIIVSRSRTRVTRKDPTVRNRGVAGPWCEILYQPRCACGKNCGILPSA